MEKISHAPASFSFFKQKQFVGSLTTTVVRTVAYATQRDDPLFFLTKIICLTSGNPKAGQTSLSSLLQTHFNSTWNQSVPIIPITPLFRGPPPMESRWGPFNSLTSRGPLYVDGGARISLRSAYGFMPNVQPL